MSEREYDLIVYGATGYTGQLVAEYLVGRCAGTGIRWALAGRNEAKLQSVMGAIGASADTPLIVADADDRTSLDAMTKQAKVIITTVGPYQLYGDKLLASCVKNGTHYADLCGEPTWMREKIEQHMEHADTTGAQICFSSGFDSIPFDLGVLKLQEHCMASLGAPATRVRGRVRAMNGKFSGGTAASLKATLAAIAKKPALAKVMTSSFGLTPGFKGADQPAMGLPYYDEAVGSWVAPFIMAAINTKNVHRTNFLLGHPWSADFRYDEMVMTSPGEMGRKAAEALAKANPLGGEKAPKPGEGPTRAEREAGNYDLLFVGETADGKEARLAVKGDMDPGYGSTSKMISETGILLAAGAKDKAGGIWTPGALLGDKLVERLEANAGISFSVEK